MHEEEGKLLGVKVSSHAFAISIGKQESKTELIHLEMPMSTFVHCAGLTMPPP